MLSHHAAAPHAPVFQTHLMATGDWVTMVTSTGTGYSRWRDLAVNRWQPDDLLDENGSCLLLRDTASGTCWSATAAPALQPGQPVKFRFAPNRARFEQRHDAIASVLEIVPLASGDGELRQLALRNDGQQSRTLDIVSYIPLVLGPAGADAAHPAFSKMFVQTACADDGQVLLAWRRKGSPSEPAVFAAHLCTPNEASVAAVGMETDRVRFIGRSRSLLDAAAFDDDEPLPGHVGTVLDPIFSLRRRVTLLPGVRVCLAFWTLAADTRAAVLARAAECHRPDAAVNTLRDAVALGPDSARTQRFQRLTTPLLYRDPAWLCSPQEMARASGGQPSLWPHGISGDRPIVLSRVGSDRALKLVREILAAQRWWQGMRLLVDVVVLANDAGQGAAAWIDELARLKDDAKEGPPGVVHSDGFFVLRASQLSRADCDGLAAVARIVLDGENGGLAAQLQRVDAQRADQLEPPCEHAQSRPRVVHSAATDHNAAAAADALEFFNGLGGFAEGGREYVMHLTGTRCTPMPWINVIANPNFGFTISAEGGGYTWATNSQKNALTPWSNDPVRDPPGDVLYIGDRDSGQFWSATPEPVRAAEHYEVRHGHGYTRFVHEFDQIACDLLEFVPLDEPVKIARLRLANRSQRPRRLCVTAYVCWKLGANGQDTAPHVVTDCDPATGALTARNDWRADFSGRVAFADLCGRQTGWTCDRHEFLGPRGSLHAPAALQRQAPLRGRCGAGLDPCAALQTMLCLQPGAEQEVVLLLGEAVSADDASSLVARLRDADLTGLLQAVHAHWDRVFEAVQIQTPDRRMDVLVNSWLPYQVIACRLNARTAFYQASGAWGFRDQLQDVGALTLSAPPLVREHLLRAASRQFPEGDAQHWWLPPHGAGVRTRMVDDRLWLPYVAAHYVDVTGDAAILDEELAFLQGKPLAEGQMDDFYTPQATELRATLFEHCARAIDCSLATGVHGLPLFGTGDWNDGMNRVGSGGKGESVWMAWFLQATIAAFAPLAEARGALERTERWRRHAAGLAGALQQHAWDGRWWLRGWYDNGTPLGAQASRDCQIDGMAQSWAVLAQAADQERVRQGMQAVDDMLVHSRARVVALLTPPFDQGREDPGYIKGYPPGLRENGGQYTHGCVWSAIAFAMLGNGDHAVALWDMLEPISHASTPQALARWQVEPYVACADVYTAPGHLGRGGWTWYTGTAGWLYRAAVESILGLAVCGASCRLDPCIPRAWPQFSIRLHWRSARYLMRVENPSRVCRGVARLLVDGVACDVAQPFRLRDDARSHQVHVTLG